MILTTSLGRSLFILRRYKKGLMLCGIMKNIMKNWRSYNACCRNNGKFSFRILLL